MSMWFANPAACRGAYDEALRAILSIEQARQSRQWLSHWRELAPGPTPVRRLPGLARRLGLAAIEVKDESVRSALGSFKVLGAPVALLRLVMRRWPERAYRAEDLLDGRHADALREFVVVSATDGNHGRALAAAARCLGCRCVIVLHAHVSAEREAPIAALGAQIVRIAGNYDASVLEAARLAEVNGWVVVSDTSYDGYEEIPRDVMQGYAAIVDELLEGAPGAPAPCPWTHVFLQGGVGGLAAGIVSAFCERYGAQRPAFIVVEPEQADCLLQSARSGHADCTRGSVDSVMAGLACGETSPLAWRFLAPAVDAFMTVDDAAAVQAMRTLADGTTGDIPVLAGESGAAGLAGLVAARADSPLARALALDANARVLLINTEGATAPGVYETLTGRASAAVLRAQADWLGRNGNRDGDSCGAAPRHESDFRSNPVAALRADLALALRAAAHHGLAEGVCNHFSIELPDGSGRFLLNPRGLLWSEIGADDIVMIDASGRRLAGRHEIEPTAMFIHAAIHRLCGQACVLHTHMPYATALTLTSERALDPCLSQNAMRFHGRVAIDAAYSGLALDAAEGERIAGTMSGKDVAFLGNHGIVVCGSRIDHAYDDLYYLERACRVQVLAQSTGRTLAPVADAISQRVGEQTRGERLQSELFFEALRRTL